MCGKEPRSDVEKNSFEGSEHLKHQAVNVSHSDGSVWSLHPEESETRYAEGDPPASHEPSCQNCVMCKIHNELQLNVDPNPLSLTFDHQLLGGPDHGEMS